ncbi:MAG TPA: hypothetical protein QGF35_05075 [Dehalococcoidia bacterium]|jgi:hypothetical protein|nr:hypothetical protein [Dehalococcoidia bacterium]
MNRAFFGHPKKSFEKGGTYLSVYIVPVVDHELVVFGVEESEARGRWLPWDVMPWGENPYIVASELVDGWCEGAVLELLLVDVMSHYLPGESWELAIVFRALLSRAPGADGVRTPALVPLDRIEDIGSFEAVDIQRWVGTSTGMHGDTSGAGLVF